MMGDRQETEKIGGRGCLGGQALQISEADPVFCTNSSVAENL